MTPSRRVEGGIRFHHQEVAVLEAFATAIAGLHHALDTLRENPQASAYWDESAVGWARAAVRAARLLTVRGELR